LLELERYFAYYFTDRRQYPAWIRQPFVFDTTTADRNLRCVDDMSELQESEIQKHTFSTTNRHSFWCHQMEWQLLADFVSV